MASGTIYAGDAPWNVAADGTDMTAQMNKVMYDGAGQKIILPAGIINISGRLISRPEYPLIMIGAGWDANNGSGTTIQMNGDDHMMVFRSLTGGSLQPLILRDLGLNGNFKARNGIYAYDMHSMVLDNVKIHRCNVDGFFGLQCHNFEAYRTSIWACGRNGAWFHNWANAITWIGGKITDNTQTDGDGANFQMTADPGYTNLHARITPNDLSNGHLGFCARIQNSRGVFLSSYAETAGRQLVQIGGDCGRIRVEGYWQDGVVSVVPGAVFVTVEANLHAQTKPTILGLPVGSGNEDRCFYTAAPGLASFMTPG